MVWWCSIHETFEIITVMAYTLEEYIAEQNRWPEYFPVAEVLWMQVYAPDKPVGLDAYDFIGSFARIEILKRKDAIQKILSTITLLWISDSIELPLDATCMNCTHKDIGYEVDCSLLHIGLGEIWAMGRGVIRTHSNMHSVCPLHQFSSYSDVVWLPEVWSTENRIPIDNFQKHIGGLIMENARIADIEWDSDIPTSVWILGEIGIRLEYDFPNQSKRVSFATHRDFEKVLSRIADMVLYDQPGKGSIRYKDITIDSGGKNRFFNTLNFSYASSRIPEHLA